MFAQMPLHPAIRLTVPAILGVLSLLVVAVSASFLLVSSMPPFATCAESEPSPTITAEDAINVMSVEYEHRGWGDFQLVMLVRYCRADHQWRSSQDDGPRQQMQVTK